MAGRWNAEPEISGGGVLIDNGTHSVDIARFFLGRISEVHAVEGRRVQGLDVEDTAQMFLRTEQDVLGTVDLSWSIDKSVDYFVRICCSEGTIEVGWQVSRYRKAGAKEWTVFGPGYDKVAAMRAEVLNFARALGGREASAHHGRRRHRVGRRHRRRLPFDHPTPVGRRRVTARARRRRHHRLRRGRRRLIRTPPAHRHRHRRSRSSRLEGS